MTHTNLAWLLLGVLVLASIAQQSPAVAPVDPLPVEPIVAIEPPSEMEPVEFVTVEKPDVSGEPSESERGHCASGNCGVRRGVLGGIFRRR